MSPQTPRMLRRRAVEAMTGLSRSTIYARMNTGGFPAAIRLGGRSVGWIAEEIEAWIASRIAESRPAGAAPESRTTPDRSSSRDRERKRFTEPSTFGPSPTETGSGDGDLP